MIFSEVIYKVPQHKIIYNFIDDRLFNQKHFCHPSSEIFNQMKFFTIYSNRIDDSPPIKINDSENIFLPISFLVCFLSEKFYKYSSKNDQSPVNSTLDLLAINPMKNSISIDDKFFTKKELAFLRAEDLIEVYV